MANSATLEKASSQRQAYGPQTENPPTSPLTPEKNATRARKRREKLFLCAAVTSASSTLLGNKSRRGAPLRQTLAPSAMIDDEHTLGLVAKLAILYTTIPGPPSSPAPLRPLEKEGPSGIAVEKVFYLLFAPGNCNWETETKEHC